ncbi:conjugative relaxase-like TrwC/TraI family protein [Arthrobacter oryzae]|uniref:Conjugative relaxase-like TrwC/TraI family protein n=1 Tax=Pseudarthrobacter enclensis TaxID=993070 RepID=A0ABT9RXQ0_9MICC|nr:MULTISPECIES: MobF family relaxase [Micrococcaceae]MDP9890014.1 conjugative relaxase-like TrwC/TraI family protein [Pseudarthrobacter enclensis]MDP9988929.1 conjugative relaxase-like TrwC/TraI family protein [Arthrobacter oryzae]
MMTVHKLSAGDGYTYYTREVATGDELRAGNRSLGDYYTVDGNPPGQWGGGGAALLKVSGEVSEAQMSALYGEGLHPDAAAILAKDPTAKVALGQRYKRFSQTDNELQSRIDRGIADYTRMNHSAPDADNRRLIRTKEGAQYFRELNGRNPADKEELGKFITAQTKPAAQAVAGYDLVFAPAKSVSVLWATGGDEARQQIEAAHHEAIKETMEFLEEEATFTRRGRNGVRQEDVEGGLVYTAFRHYDSRNGDPQLHDHIVVANKVMGADGKWSSLDGRLLYQYGVAASEHYNRTVMEKVCARLGVGVTTRKVTGDRPVIEIAGVNIAAIEAGSSRSGDIKPVLDNLVQEFTENHGYSPNQKQMIALAQQATLATRPAKKSARRLSELVTQWQQEFAQIPGVLVGPAAIEAARAHRYDARNAADRSNTPLVTHADEVDPAVEAAQVIRTLERSRGTWGEHHIDAETRRQLGSRFAELTIPKELFEQVKARAIDQFSLRITTDVPAAGPEALRLRNGASRYGKVHSTLYTSSGVLHSEDRLLTAAQRTVIPAATTEFFDTAAASQEKTFDAGQLRMASEFACSDKLLVIGVGPAGAGKTTALKLSADAIRAAGGNVVGLAPTAAAAAVMGKELGANATTIDSFVLGHRNHSPNRIPLNPGDVLFIDEAGMVGTELFAAAVTIAEQHGALVRALGDDQQLSAVASGGAMRYLKNTVGAVYLEDLHRFRNADGTPNTAEAAATLALREPPAVGEDDPWEFYRQNRRVVGGDVETMTSQVYTAWEKDTAAGKHSVMMAFDNATVTDLNARAQAYRLGTGALADGPAAALRDGLAARAGDVVVTRKNDRRLSVNHGKDFVKNNDVWTVREVHPDGAMTVRHQDHNGTITLPADYVRDNAMLGYAATIHRTQGMTCDTTHAMIGSGLSRALAYVAASRGRESNHLYGVLADGETLTDVLRSVAGNHDGNLTAHEQIDAARAAARSLPEMVTVYKDIDDQANELRMANTARSILGERTAEPFIASDAWGAVATHLRNAESEGFNIANLLTDATGTPFEESQDPGAVLAWRVEDKLDYWRTRAEAPARRPLEAVSDQALERLARRVTGDLMRARADSATNPASTPDHQELSRNWLKENKETPWQSRLHGHLTDDDLDTRIRRAKETLRTDETVNDSPAAAKANWLAGSLQKEKALRELMPEPVRADETYERGATTNYARDENAPRVRAAEQILRRIETEQNLRRRLPEPVATTPVPDGLAPWMAPADVITHKDTPSPWRTELQARREAMALEVNRLGSQLAAEPPAWAAALGPVPSDTAKQQQWRDLAVEVKTFRDTYRIPDAETTVIPDQYTQQGTGADLLSRVTAMHKYSAQTAKEPLSGTDAVLMAEAANVEAAVAETPTPAEQVVDQLRQERSQDTTLTPEQERAERIAAMARRIRGTSKTSTPEQTPEAVTEAMKDIAERRHAEKDTQPSAPAESLRDRLARVRQETESALTQTPNAAEKIRQAQQAQEAEDAKRRAQQNGPATGPETGRRGPRL